MTRIRAAIRAHNTFAITPGDIVMVRLAQLFRDTRNALGYGVRLAAPNH